MPEVHAGATRDPLSASPGSYSPGWPSAVIALVLIAGFEVIVIGQFQPPAALPLNAPPTQFSSGRAMQHLRMIAQKPHPTGSAENARVRSYLVEQFKALGMNPTIQTATAVFGEKRWHGPIPAAAVNNIVATLKGESSNSKAVMLTAHYDSVPGGPGASDDGSGTVTLLETARALKAGPPLRNDVIFLLTDGEELGLLGAQAFREAYPRLKDIGVVLNFDSRGACGPCLMFETSEQNGWLFRQFAKAAPHPIASSDSYEAYKRMPNDTDLTIFKRAGLAGLNFGYVGCWTRYHTREDTVQNIDERSLQHEGSYALALARRFGDLKLERTKSPDVVYTTPFGIALYYPEWWAGPLLIVVLLRLITGAHVGFKKRRLTSRGILFGCFGWLLGAILGTMISAGLWRAFRAAGLASVLPYGMAYNGDLFAAASIALTVSTVTSIYIVLRKRAAPADLILGSLAWWVIVAVLTTLIAPGASFLFVWPVLFNLIALEYTFDTTDPETKEYSLGVWALPAALGIIVFGAMPYEVVQLASTTALPLVTMSSALLLGLLAPLLLIIVSRLNWSLPGLAALAAIGFLVAAGLRSGYDRTHPRADSIAYLLNADNGAAVWVSGDRTPDQWTSHLLTGGTMKTTLGGLTGRSALSAIEAPAPALKLAPPQVVALDDIGFGDQRTLRLLVSSPRGARVAWITVEHARVLEASVNGKKVPMEGYTHDAPSWRLTYVGVPSQGVALTLTVPASAAPVLKVTDQSEGLPEIPGMTLGPRPEDLMPSPTILFDSSTLVSKTFEKFEMAHTMAH